MHRIPTHEAAAGGVPSGKIRIAGHRRAVELDEPGVLLFDDGLRPELSRRSAIVNRSQLRYTGRDCIPVDPNLGCDTWIASTEDTVLAVSRSQDVRRSVQWRVRDQGARALNDIADHERDRRVGGAPAPRCGFTRVVQCPAAGRGWPPQRAEIGMVWGCSSTASRTALR